MEMINKILCKVKWSEIKFFEDVNRRVYYLEKMVENRLLEP